MSDMNDFNCIVIEEFCTNGGKVGGQFVGVLMIFVMYKGAKSGKEYMMLFVYLTDGDCYVIIVSKGGVFDDFQWFCNLVVNFDIMIEVGDERFAARVHVVEGDERECFYWVQVMLMFNFDEYVKNTIRQIFVVVLVWV